jgi:hypothetical protein
MLILLQEFYISDKKNNYYEKLIDLLGGEFFVDLNQFAERDFPNDPNAAPKRSQ